MKKILVSSIAIGVVAATMGITAAKAGDQVYRAGYPAVVVHHYVSNGSFDWRRARNDRRPIPWYAYDEGGHCFTWTEHAYHYACDPNARY